MPLHLRNRAGIWHYSRTVPPDVRGVIGVPYWRFTLGTSSLREAETLRSQWDVKHDALIADVRRMTAAERMAAIRLPRPKGRPPKAATALPGLSGVTIDTAQALKVKPEAERQHRYALTDHKGATEDARKAYLAAESGALLKAVAVVSTLTPEERKAIDKAGGIEAFYRTSREARQKSNLKRLLNPQPADEEQAITREVKARVLASKEKTLTKLGLLAGSVEEVPPSKDNPRILDALETWLKKFPRKPPTVVKYRLHVGRLANYFHNTTLKTLTPAMIEEFASAYAEIPNARHLKLAQRTLSMRELLALRVANPDLDGCGDQNVLKMTDYVRAFFKAAKRHDLKDALERPRVQRDHDEVKAFTPFDLRRILPALEKHFGHADDLTWWCYLMAYSGARPEEAAKLQRRDVEIGRKQIAISITDTGGRKIKNKASVRTIPTHPVLIERGFKSFVESRSDRLFESFTLDPKGDYSNNASRRLKRVLSRLKIEGDDGSAHRFRHSFITAARNAELPYSVELALVGHAESGVRAKYGEPASFKTMARVIGRIDPLRDVTDLDDE